MAGHMVMMVPTRIKETSMNFNQLKQHNRPGTSDSNIRRGESMKSHIFLCCHPFLGIKIAGNVVQDTGILCVP
jgi:(p)ppGpp synthase/HD superfamily hydrolase